MAVVLLLNNYSSNRVYREIAAGYKPTSHLYGAIELEKMGYKIIFVDPDFSSVLYKFGKLLAKIPLCNFGDLYLQYYALVNYKKYDFVYASCQDVTTLIGILSYLKIFRKPIFALAHHSFLTGKLAFFRQYSLFFALKGHKVFFSLSETLAKQLNQIAHSAISKNLYWGPDVPFFKRYAESFLNDRIMYDIIAIGRTGRDYKTLVNAFIDSNVKVLICCHKNFRKSLPSTISSNIVIKWLDSEEELNYLDIIKLYRSAKILAIPMVEQDNLCGLTSITDAIALKMPVLITYNAYINIDPELNKFGYWINPYDANSWREKANKILSDDYLYATLVVNSGKAAEKYNIEKFSQQLNAVFVTT